MAVAIPKAVSSTDVIPIHTHDRASFKRCRRYWDWSSPTRSHLRPRADIAGINIPLWFGTGIHYALEQFYHPQLPRDPVEAFIEWYQWQWEGGRITREQLEMSYDPNPVAVPRIEQDTEGREWEFEGYYEVKGIRDFHPDPDDEEYETHRALGIAMMEYYRDQFAPVADAHTEVIAAEHVFSVPIRDPYGEIVFAFDKRDGKSKEVHARGKMDAIFYSHEHECYGIRDHKTCDPAKFFTDDYWDGLAQDEQITTYMWAAQEEAKLYDLPYKEIKWFDYNVLRKAAPRDPTPLKDKPFPSINRSTESTTYDRFMDYIEKMNLHEWVKADEKRQLYVDYLEAAGHSHFIRRDTIFRNPYELQSCGERLFAEAADMLDPTLFVYPNLTKEWRCLRCAFRAPCLARNDGSDWQYMLDNNFEVNPYGR